MAANRRQKKKAPFPAPSAELAEWTGLEPATSGVTGQHSNRLNYHSAFLKPSASNPGGC